jgi:hypothetical protein
LVLPALHNWLERNERSGQICIWPEKVAKKREFPETKMSKYFEFRCQMTA